MRGLEGQGLRGWEGRELESQLTKLQAMKTPGTVDRGDIAMGGGDRGGGAPPRQPLPQARYPLEIQTRGCASGEILRIRDVKDDVLR